MSRKLLVFLGVLVLVGLTTTTVFAGKYRLNATFALGSLIASGDVSGLGNQDVTLILDATGDPVVTCTNQGSNQAPGQNPSKVSATGTQFLPGNDTLRKNGKSPFDVETNDPVLTAVQGGCPNNNWTATTDFVFWTAADITVKDTAGKILTKQHYTCTTTRTPASVTCTPTN